MCGCVREREQERESSKVLKGRKNKNVLVVKTTKAFTVNMVIVFVLKKMFSMHIVKILSYGINDGDLWC